MSKINVSEEIRKLLQAQPGLCFNDAEPIFKTRKLSVSRTLFNTVKLRFAGAPTIERRKARTAVAPTPVSIKTTAASTKFPLGLNKALEFVNEHCGLNAVRELSRQAAQSVSLIESYLDGVREPAGV